MMGITKAVKKHKESGGSLEEKDYSNILWWKEVSELYDFVAYVARLLHKHMFFH